VPRDSQDTAVSSEPTATTTMAETVATEPSAPREQDRYLPIANIGRIMKRAIPPNAKIAKDARDIVQECVSEFISFITSEASDKCARERRKTINGDDLLWALDVLMFKEYDEPLRKYLEKYKLAEKLDKGTAGEP
jgi:nuclear transcription Y subunit beta